MALDQQYLTNAEFQYVYDQACLCWSYGKQAGRAFTLLGDSDRARCHARLENMWKEQVIGAVQGMVEETNRC